MYAALGGLVIHYARVEQWPFYDAFYFAFISCMKIGFGDIVPENALGIYVSIVYR